MKKMKVPVRIIGAVDIIMNLSVLNIINVILAKYGFGYLLNYIFWISLVL